MNLKHRTQGTGDPVAEVDRTPVGEPTSRNGGPGSSRPDAVTPVGRGALTAAGVAGLIYVAAGWVTFPDGPTMTTASADRIRSYVEASGGAIRGAAIAGMIAVAAGLVLFPALVRQVRDRLPDSLLADVVLGAGIVSLVYQLLMVTSEGLLRYLPKLLDSFVLAEVDDATVQGWYGLTGFTHFLGDLAIVPAMAIIAAFSLAARRGRLLPGWLVWAGMLIVALGVLGTAGVLGEVGALYPFWIAGLMSYFLWILAISVTFLVRVRRHGREVGIGARWT